MNEEERLELKVQGLRESFRERIALLTDDYENRIVDLRVSLTSFDNRANSLQTENEELRQRIAVLEAEAAGTADATSEDSNDSD